MPTSLSFTLDDLKYGVPEKTLQRAVKLYQEGKVTKVRDGGRRSTTAAIVIGSKPYHVVVFHKSYDMGYCDCYLGQNDELCKHMIALALHMVCQGEPLVSDLTKVKYIPESSGELRQITTEELRLYKKEITQALKYIKYYQGPSRTWFTYQASLSEGCVRLSEIVSRLPVCLKSAQLLVDLALRIDKKLQYGVDDSDGTVGGFVEGVVEMLIEFYKLDPSCIKVFNKLAGVSTCWDWEAPLVRLVDEQFLLE